MTNEEFVNNMRNRMAWIEGRLRNIEGGSPFNNEIVDIEMEIGGMTADVEATRERVGMVKCTCSGCWAGWHKKGKKCMCDDCVAKMIK